jgi:hypothetical protein
MNNVRGCIYFNMTASHMTGVVIQNNVLRPAEGGFGVEYYTGESDNNTNAYMRDLILLGNVIYPSATATNVTALKLNSRITATVIGNVLQGGGKGADFFVNPSNDPAFNPLAPLQIITWAGNVNLSGTLLSKARRPTRGENDNP